MRKRILMLLPGLIIFLSFISGNALLAQKTEYANTASSTNSSYSADIYYPPEVRPGLIIEINNIGKYYSIQDTETSEIYTFYTDDLTLFSYSDLVYATIQRARGGKVIVRSVTR